MRKMHKILLAVVLLAAVTVVGMWMASSHKPDTRVSGYSISSQVASYTLSTSDMSWWLDQQAGGALMSLANCRLCDAFDSCARPSAVIPPSASVAKLHGQGMYARLGRANPQASIKGHRNQSCAFACENLCAPAALLLYTPTHVLTSSTDPILDIPLNRGPTS